MNQQIKFVGKKQEAPEFLTDGSTKIVLPENQSKPFTHSEAKRILRAFPELYKKVVQKNGKPQTGESTENPPVE